MRRLHLLLLTAPFLVLACGGDNSPSPVALLTAAPEKTREAQTARVEFDIRTDGVPGSTGTVEMRADGEIDFERPRLRMTMDLGAITPGAGEMEVISDGTTMYMRFPAAFQQGGVVSTPWVSFDLRELSERVGGVDLAQLQQANQDPTQALAYLKGTSDEIEEVGDEEVRGVDTTRYRATIDLRRAYEEAEGVTDPERFEALIDQFGVDEIEMDVWIDDEGRARRTAWEQPLPTGGDMSLVMDIFDFGADVSIEPPPADQVTDITDLAANAPRPPR